MQRAILGVLALVGIFGGLYLLFSELPEFWSESLAPVALRAGLLLGALWLALPQVQQLARRLSPATVLIAGAVLLFIVLRPTKILLYLLPVLLVMGILQWLGRVMAPAPRRRR